MKKTILTSLVAMVAITGGWYLLLARPAYSRIEKLEQHIAAENEKLDSYQLALLTLDKQIREFNETYASILESRGPFSGKDELMNLYHIVDSLCQAEPYSLEEITPSLKEIVEFLRQWENSKGSSTIPIQIIIQGEYRPLTELIETLEKSSYFNHLISCRMSGAEDIYPKCTLELNFAANLSNRMELFDVE